MNSGASDSRSEPAKAAPPAGPLPSPPSPKSESTIVFLDGPDLGPDGFGMYGLSLHSGPLPSPQTLAEYKRIDPSLPGEILAMAKASAAHIQAMEAKDLERQIAMERGDRIERRIGQFMGFGVTVLGLGVSCVLALYDQPTVASIIGGTTVVALAGVFIAGRILEAGGADEQVPGGPGAG